MRTWLASFFAPPTFSTREENRQAALLNLVLWLGLGLTLFALFSNSLFSPDPQRFLPYQIILVLAVVIALSLLHRGILRPTAILICIGLWLSILANMLVYGWPLSTTVGNLFAMTLIAGLLLGPGWGLASAVANLVSVLAFVYLQQAGYAPVFSGLSPYRGAANLGGNLLLVALLVWLNARDFGRLGASIDERQSLLLEHSLQLEAMAEIAAAASTGRDLTELMGRVVNLLAKHFNLYCVLLFQVDEDQAVLRPSAISRNREKATINQIEPIPLDARSILAHVVRTRSHYLAKDIAQDPYYRHFPILPATESELALPIIAGVELFGVLDVLSDEAPSLGQDEVNVLQVLANHIGTAIHNRMLLEATQRHLDELTALHQTATAAIEAASEDDLIERTTQIIGEALFPENFGVILTDEASGLLYHHQSYAERNGKEQPPIPLGAGVTGVVALSGMPLRVPDVREEPKYIPVDSTTRSELCVPIQAGEHVLGVINVESSKVDAFSEADEQLLQAVGGQLAISLERIRLHSDASARAEELQQALAQQEELSQLKDEFIQNVSHEFRTPLAIVSGYVEILNSGEFGKLPKEYAQPVDIISRRVDLLSNLVDDLTSILELHTAQERFADIRLFDLLENLQQNLVIQAMSEQHVLRFELDAETPPVLGEGTYLRKAVENLVNNALKFTPAGGNVTVRLKSQDSWVLIEVEDTGIGIPESELERIFERFYQVDGSTSRAYGGTGLGLALVREIAQLHRGEVEVQSAEGQGSRFTIRLPAMTQSRLL